MKYNIDKINTTLKDLESNNLNQYKNGFHYKKYVNIKINNDSIRNKIQ